MHVRKSASAKRWLCVGCIYDMDCRECECHRMVIDSVHGEELVSVLFERWVSGGALSWLLGRDKHVDSESAFGLGVQVGEQ